MNLETNKGYTAIFELLYPNPSLSHWFEGISGFGLHLRFLLSIPRLSPDFMHFSSVAFHVETDLADRHQTWAVAMQTLFVMLFYNSKPRSYVYYN